MRGGGVERSRSSRGLIESRTRSRVSSASRVSGGVYVKAHEQKSLRKSESFLKSTSVDFDDDDDEGDNMETDLDLVDLQEDRSGFNRNKPIKQVLTVQEKLAQDYPSLPPQAEVYMNLIDDDFAAGVDQPSSYQAIDR